MKIGQAIITQSPEETMQLAKEFSKSLKPGDILALEGNLGSGKTTFIKGIAEGLGLQDTRQVTSPTFALMNIYQTRIPLYHFDLYRLEQPKEIQSIGFDEFIADSKVIKCIEWAERAKDFFPEQTRYISFEVIDEIKRKITLK